MNRFSFFCNRECEYYPCHKTDEPLNFLFCFCPLYSFEACGGRFTFTDKGIKDCSTCTIPHRQGGYGFIITRLTEGDHEQHNCKRLAGRREPAGH